MVIMDSVCRDGVNEPTPLRMQRGRGEIGRMNAGSWNYEDDGGESGPRQYRQIVASGSTRLRHAGQIRMA